jgi:hypothetical protein
MKDVRGIELNGGKKIEVDGGVCIEEEGEVGRKEERVRERTVGKRSEVGEEGGGKRAEQ